MSPDANYFILVPVHTLAWLGKSPLTLFCVQGFNVFFPVPEASRVQHHFQISTVDKVLALHCLGPQVLP